MSYGQYRAVLATNRNQADRRAGVPRALRHVRQQPQHLRDALSRRLPARLVPRARARLPDDARRGAARQRHPAIGRRQPDRDDARRRRAAAPLPPAAAPRAQARPLLSVRLLDPDHRVEPALRLRRGARADRRRRRAARRRTTRRACGAGSASAGSTSTRTTASAAAPTPRRCTACIPYMLHELGRHAGRRVHAGARDGPLDAHDAVARAAAVRLLGLHDLRRRSAVDADRGPAARAPARAAPPTATSGSCCCSTRSTTSRARSTRRCCSPISSWPRTSASSSDEPITAEVLNALYKERFDAYYGDSVDIEDLTPITWARIPHFFNTPYYVYQYATCFASAAKLAGEIT